MAATDSVSVFAEGTFEEQIQELVTYLARSHPEEERQSYIQPFRDVLTAVDNQRSAEKDVERRRKVLKMVLDEVKGLGGGSEREIEGFFNLLFAHFVSLFSVESPDTRGRLVSLVQLISSADAQPSLKYRILSNLFNAIPCQSGLRLIVHQNLVALASANDELEVLQLSKEDIARWLSEWDVSSEEKSAFLKLLVDAFEKAGDPESSYQYKILYVRSISPGSASEAAAADLIATALRLPSVFDFDPLFRLDAVVAARDHELFSLLQVFLNEGLPQYKEWEASHADAFAQYDLDKAQLERKIGLLSLATLGYQNIGRDVPYAVLAAALQVDVSQVERWVIDVIRAGLISGKLSQTSQTLHITRATARAFEREQWEALEKRLVAWKAGLAGVMEVVASAKRGNVPETSQANASNTVETAVPQPQATAA